MDGVQHPGSEPGWPLLIRSRIRRIHVVRFHGVFDVDGVCDASKRGSESIDVALNAFLVAWRRMGHTQAFEHHRTRALDAAPSEAVRELLQRRLRPEIRM